MIPISLTTKETSYPFEFFCEEYYDESQVFDIVREAYEAMARDDDRPPSVGILQRDLQSFFSEGLIVRVLLRDDYQDVWVRTDLIREKFESRKEALKEFVRDYLEDFNFYSHNPEMWEKFARDIRHVLNVDNLFFIDGDSALFKRASSPGSGEQILIPIKPQISLHNIPIVKVW